MWIDPVFTFGTIHCHQSLREKVRVILFISLFISVNGCSFFWFLRASLSKWKLVAHFSLSRTKFKVTKFENVLVWTVWKDWYLGRSLRILSNVMKMDWFKISEEQRRRGAWLTTGYRNNKSWEFKLGRFALVHTFYILLITCVWFEF